MLTQGVPFCSHRGEEEHMDGGLEQPPGCPELGGLTHRDSDSDPSWHGVYVHPAEPRGWWREPVPSPSLPVVVSHEASKCNTLQPFFFP